jgi:LuxR family maltose regulon positive regulatory protein
MEWGNVDQHLLATKLAIPPIYRDKIIPRQRLYGQLDTGVQHSLLLVSAPAGFGKTTLVAEWLHRKGVSAAWVSLEKADNEFIRFWHYIITALCRQYADIRQKMDGEVGCPFHISGQAILTSLLDVLLYLSEDVLLVLDDYQVITDSAIHQSMSFLLAHLPPRVHLLLITRADPPLAIARLHVQGKLTELREADLRLTVDEACLFLNQTMGFSLTRRQVEELCRRTDGWMAGIQLAALSLNLRGDVSHMQHFIDTFTDTDRNIVGLAQPLRERARPLLEMLSEREYSVLCLVSEGLSNQEIANHLSVEVSTVKTHLNNIYAKFQVHTRLQAVIKAYDLGLLGPWTKVSPGDGKTENAPFN